MSLYIGRTKNSADLVAGRVSGGGGISEIPIASKTSLGTIIVGSNLSITDSGILTANVEDSLVSNSKENALSANQGQVLDKKIESLTKKVIELDVSATWSGQEAPYTQVLELKGVTTDDIVSIYPLWSADHKERINQRKEFNKIDVVTSNNDAITLTCDTEKPEIALKIRAEY